MIEKRKMVAAVRRLLLGTAAAIAAGGGSWVNPNPAVPSPSLRRGVPDAIARESGQPALLVSAWGFSHSPGGAMPQAGAPTGGPLYLWFELRGDERVLVAMRASGGLPIEVHWTPPPLAAPTAPPLTTAITVGRPGLAGALEREVQRSGSFLWRAWAEKTTLSPGRWRVTLTYPDGRPLACAPANEPCQFTIDIG
jgi:hypothetical protein